MAAEGYKRKVTAIMSADVAGYSRLMGDNESETVKTLEAYKQVMFALIKQHRGRVVHSPGDNLPAEFGSVVDAVQCGGRSKTNSRPGTRTCRKTVGCSSGSGSSWGMCWRRESGSMVTG